MTGRTHDVAAFTSCIVVLVYTPTLPEMSLVTIVAAFGANFIGGLFPDIDQPTSDLWDNFRLGTLFAKFIPKILGGHRHISHSIVGVWLIGYLSLKLLNYISTFLLININMQIVWYAFMIGVISHLIMDLITKDGIPLLWPLRWKIGFPPFKFLRITAGKFTERIIIFPSLLLYTGYLIFIHQNTILFFIRNKIK